MGRVGARYHACCHSHVSSSAPAWGRGCSPHTRGFKPLGTLRSCHTATRPRGQELAAGEDLAPHGCRNRTYFLCSWVRNSSSEMSRAQKSALSCNKEGTERFGPGGREPREHLGDDEDDSFLPPSAHAGCGCAGSAGLPCKQPVSRHFWPSKVLPHQGCGLGESEEVERHRAEVTKVHAACRELPGGREPLCFHLPGSGARERSIWWPSLCRSFLASNVRADMC